VTLGFEVAQVEIAGDPDEGTAVADNLLTRLLRGYEDPVIFFATIASRRIDGGGPDLDEESDIAAIDIASASGELQGQGPSEILFASDGAWCGWPDDFGAAHSEAIPIVDEIDDIRTEVPYLPEADRRLSTFTARVSLINDDGALDDYPFERSIDGQSVRIDVGLARGYSSDWALAAKARGRSVTSGLEQTDLELENIGDLLDAPVVRGRFNGTGGERGDANLAGQIYPMALGRCPNVTPVTLVYASNTFRFSTGPSNAVEAVYDSRVPLAFDGNDYPDFTSLQLATIAPGAYATCLALSLVRTGAEPVGSLTMDVQGSTLFGVYSAFPRNIISWLWRGPGGLPDIVVNTGSLGVLEDYAIGIYLDGTQSFTIAQLMNGILRPYNGHYGQFADGRLGVGAINADTFEQGAWTLDRADIKNLDPDNFDEPPRWRQSFKAARNWTPLDADEIALDNPSVTPENAAFAQREYQLVTAEDATVLLRHADPVDGDNDEGYGPIETYIVDPADAQKAADKLLAYLKLRKTFFDEETGLQLLPMAPGSGGAIVAGRLGLDETKKAISVRKSISSGDRGVSLRSIVALDL